MTDDQQEPKEQSATARGNELPVIVMAARRAEPELPAHSELSDTDMSEEKLGAESRTKKLYAILDVYNAMVLSLFVMGFLAITIYMGASDRFSASDVIAWIIFWSLIFFTGRK